MRSFHLLCLALLALRVSPAAAQADVFPALWTTSGTVEGMAVLGDTLFLAGGFDYVGPPTGQLAVLDKATGEPSLALPRFTGAGISGSSSVDAVVLDEQGGYYVGGYFAFVSGQYRRNLARVRADGTLDPAFRPDPVVVTPFGDTTGTVDVLALDPHAPSPSGAGVLYVGGAFNTVGGEARSSLAALDAATGAVLPLSVAFTPHPDYPYLDPRVGWLGVRDGVLYLAGLYGTAGGVERPFLALDAESGAVLPWEPQADAPYGPLALTDSSMFIQGEFTTVGGQPRRHVAEVQLYDRATGTGSEPTAWAVTFGLCVNSVTTVAFTPDHVWLGGSYYQCGGGYGASLMRVPRAGGAAQPFQTYPPAPAEGLFPPDALAYDQTGEAPSGGGVLYVTADRPDGARRYPVVTALDAVTAEEVGFEARISGDGTAPVGVLAVEPGPTGRLFVGGLFVSAGGVRRPGLAALSLTTGRALDFGATDGAPFEDLALSPDGRFLYGYYAVLGGAALRLAEYDLATGAVREFFPQGAALTPGGARAADDGTAPTGWEAARRVEQLLDATRPQAPPPALAAGAARDRDAAGSPYVANSPSALVVTDDRVCLSLVGVACLDRATTDDLFYASMAYFASDTEDNGDLLLVPAGGPGGPGGTLFLAAPIAEAPPGNVLSAFAAVDAATGDIIEEWNVLDQEIGGPEGYGLAYLDPDGAAGPSGPALYLGGSSISPSSDVDRDGVLAVDPATAVLLPWAPRVTGGQTTFASETVHAMAAQPTADGAGGVVYVAGGFNRVNGEDLGGRGVAAFDAVTGAHVSAWSPWAPRSRVLLLSERHGAVFIGGAFETSLRGSGHAFVVAVTPAVPFAVSSEPEAPGTVAAASLSLAGPNPFRSATALSLSLPSSQAVTVALFDVLGRRVAVLHDGVLGAGTHTLAVDGSALPAGVYVARVAGDAFTESLTLTVVR